MNEVYKYTMIVGALPHPLLHPKQAKKVVKFLDGLEGLYGIKEMKHPQGGKCTLIAFNSYNEAKSARRAIRRTGNRVSRYIMKARVDENGVLEILEPAEGEVVNEVKMYNETILKKEMFDE